MTQPGEGYSREPGSVVERAADAAIKAAEALLEAEDAELKQMIVLVYADGAPPGELDCVSAGHGYDDGRELLADIFAHFSGAAKAMGLEVKLAPFGMG
jgi:hypothetical protein